MPGAPAQSRDSRPQPWWSHIHAREAAVLLRSALARRAVRLRSPDQRTAANTSEHAPARPSVFGDVRPCSLAFAVLEGNRGERLELAFLSGFRAAVYGFSTAIPRRSR